MRDVVKRCRPTMRGPRRAVLATTDRLSGIAVIARRFADMQGDPESRNKRSLQYPTRSAAQLRDGDWFRSSLKNRKPFPSTWIRLPLVFFFCPWGSTHLFVACRAGRISDDGPVVLNPQSLPDSLNRIGPQPAGSRWSNTLHSVTPQFGLRRDRSRRRLRTCVTKDGR